MPLQYFQNYKELVRKSVSPPNIESLIVPPPLPNLKVAPSSLVFSLTTINPDRKTVNKTCTRVLNMLISYAFHHFTTPKIEFCANTKSLRLFLRCKTCSKLGVVACFFFQELYINS